MGWVCRVDHILVYGSLAAGAGASYRESPTAGQLERSTRAGLDETVLAGSAVPNGPCPTLG